jgi:hypothetical protein
MSLPTTRWSEARRRFLQTGIFSAVSGLIGSGRRTAEAQDAKAPAGDGDRSPVIRTGEPVTAHMRQGSPPEQPLDSMMVFERGDNNNGRAMTHEILSLIHQEKGKKSYPWTLYSSLETHHDEGDACVLCSRLHKHGAGWSSGLHSEVFNHGRAVALGVNIEMSSDYVGTETTQVIGLNIQAVQGPRAMQYGIQLQDGQGHFTTGIGLNGKSETGIDLAGHYGVGLNTHHNTIRVSEGTCIEFDEKGSVRMRYFNGRIEFLNGDKCVGHIDVNGPDHPM